MKLQHEDRDDYCKHAIGERLQSLHARFSSHFLLDSKETTPVTGKSASTSFTTSCSAYRPALPLGSGLGGLCAIPVTNRPGRDLTDYRLCSPPSWCAASAPRTLIRTPRDCLPQ